MTSYYNEIDPYAAQWLRNLIAAGHIASGEVDTRSIVDVRPSDLVGFTQCHFFAGIGGWSLALRLAGWPDDRPVWTGSCPCQPFSAAGKRGGFDDERHLWPVFHKLIAACRPPVVMGEQVASKDGLTWLASVFADLEGAGYLADAVDCCAAGVGAPHIRQRLWWVGERVADADDAGLEGRDREHTDPRLRPAPARHSGSCGAVGLVEHATGDGRIERRAGADGRGSAGGCGDGGLAHHHHHGREGLADAGLRRAELHDADGRGADGRLGHAERIGAGRDAGAGIGTEGGASLRAVGDDDRPPGAVGGLADADEGQRGPGGNGPGEAQGAHAELAGRGVDSHRPSPSYIDWGSPDWLFCRDGKWRPVETGTFPLVARIPQAMVRGGDPSAPIDPDRSSEARVGRLRGYGNSIVPQVAAEVIAAFMETSPCAD